jgi:uncharacterized protein YqgV (UPF0045/DUF77 family)
VSRPGHVTAEFLVEPFVEGSPGPHVTAAVTAVERHGLVPVVGPFGTTVEGPADVLADALRDVVAAAMAAGASRVQVQVVPEGASTAAVRLDTLHDALGRLIHGVEHELGARLDALPREGKQAAVRLLNERGAFLLRRGVEDVAEAMGVSRITIYNYLNAIER